MVGPVESQTLDSFQEAMNINFFGALHTTLAVLPQMLARGNGAIVNIGSIGGKVAFPHLLPYVASKFAITGWSQGPARGAYRQRDPGNHGFARHHAHWLAHSGAFYGQGRKGVSLVRRRRQPPRNRDQCDGRRQKSGDGPSYGVGGSFDWVTGDRCRRVSNVAPELTAHLLSLANSFLPDPPNVIPSFGKRISQSQEKPFAARFHPSSSDSGPGSFSNTTRRRRQGVKLGANTIPPWKSLQNKIREFTLQPREPFWPGFVPASA